MQRSVHTRCLHALLACLVLLGMLSHPAWALTSDGLYYRIGGGGPVSVSAGTNYHLGQYSLGLHWDMGSSCSGLDPMATVSNQLNGVTQGFKNLMGSIVQNATGAVASLPAMIIQRAAPELYDLLSNGVLQGKLDFNKAKLSCQAMAKKAADVIMSGGWQQQAKAESWDETADTNSDAVAAQQTVESKGGDDGVTWVAGDKAGGLGQPPIRVTRDTAIAGYNILQGRANTTTSTAPVGGGGAGWGSVTRSSGPWVGGSPGGPSGNSMTGSGCRGGMCTVWGSPTEAADWIAQVVGQKAIRTCGGCEKIDSSAGRGLIPMLEKEQDEIETKLVAMVNGSEPINDDNLRHISAGSTLSVSAAVVKALRKDSQKQLLAHRLASEMALARTLTQAMWARRILLAGSDEPGIANNDQGQQAIDEKLDHLDRGIDALRTEMSIRKSLANNTASVILARRHRRGSIQSPAEGQRRNQEPRLDSRNPNDDF